MALDLHVKNRKPGEPGEVYVDAAFTTRAAVGGQALTQDAKGRILKADGSVFLCEHRLRVGYCGKCTEGGGCPHGRIGRPYCGICGSSDIAAQKAADEAERRASEQDRFNDDTTRRMDDLEAVIDANTVTGGAR